MKPLELLYEGKAKKVYKTEDEELLWIEYKDDATAFNGLKKGSISGKGELNNRISAAFFLLLKDHGVESHFVRLLSPTEQLVRRVTIVPIEVVVRNIAAGSLAKRLGLEEGTALKRTVVEFYYKDDELGDPLLNNWHIFALELADAAQLEQMAGVALQVNDVLRSRLSSLGITLVDFKLEFGTTSDGELILADEISPDTCRFWDSATGEKLDKDRFRRDLGGLREAYEEIYRRLGGEEHV